VRVGVAIVVVACAVLVLTLLRFFAFGAEATEQEANPPSEIAAPEFCPRYVPTHLPPGFALRKRETRNLGGDTIGRSYVYGAGSQTLEIHVGFEALDLYEDLDFVQHEAVADGERRTVHVPSALSSGFLAVTWEDPDSEPPCSGITLIGRRLDEATLLNVAAGLRRSEG
jgi:hypothetical protein